MKKNTVPKLGVIAPLTQDSLVYAAGFRVLGESVSRMLSPSLTDKEFEQNLRIIKAAKCKVYLCNIFFPATLKIAGPAVDEQKVIAYAETVFSRAKRAGVSFIVLGSGGSRRIPDGYHQEDAKKSFVSLCKQLATTAGKYGITIVLEQLQSSETNFLNTLESAAGVVKAVNHRNFKLNVDIFHMMRENEPPEHIIAAGDLIVHCEVAEKLNRSFPGVRQDDFKPYFRALKMTGYDGPVFIEGHTDDPAHDMPLAFQYLSRQLAEVYTE